MVHRQSIATRRQRGRLFVVLATAGLLWLVATLPVMAGGPLRLSASSVNPGSGSAGATFTFVVTYTSKDDLAPAWVRVVLDGSPRSMSALDPTATGYRNGVRFRLAIPLAAGTHTFSFSASDSKARGVTLAGGSVRVRATTAPAATPVPAATPQPAATQRPAPDQAPIATAAPGGVGPDPAPDSAPSDPGSPPIEQEPGPAASEPPSGVIPGAGADATPGLPGDGGLTPGRGATAEAEDTPAPETGSGGPAAGPDAGNSDPRIGTGEDPVGPIGALLPDVDGSQGGGSDVGQGGTTGGAIAGSRGGTTSGRLAAISAGLPGFGSDRWLRLAVQGALISTTASTAVAMALFTFRRRRDDAEGEPDGQESDPSTEASPPELSRLITPPPSSADEAAMPRWRRPSLMAARKQAPGTDLAMLAAERLTFERTGAEPDAGHERRRIKYRLVRLSDGPDEIDSAEIGRLDEGDEVELLERTGSYWRVRTPTGHEGWVHRMTLGETISAASEQTGGIGVDPDGQTAFAIAGGAEMAPDWLPGESLAARLMRERAGH